MAPDGRRLVLRLASANDDLWLYDIWFEELKQRAPGGAR